MADTTIAAGTLQHRILIQSRTAVQDGYGQQQDAYSDVRTTWASVRAASSREVYAASGFVSQLTHVITIRYSASAAVSAGMRVLFRGRVFDIQAVSDPDETRTVLNLYCMERA